MGMKYYNVVFLYSGYNRYKIMFRKYIDFQYVNVLKSNSYLLYIKYIK